MYRRMYGWMDGYQYIYCLSPAGGRIRSQGNNYCLIPFTGLFIDATIYTLVNIFSSGYFVPLRLCDLSISCIRTAPLQSRNALLVYLGVCLLLQDLLQSCARGGGGEWRTCAMRYDEPRLGWTRLTTTH
jgi:O-antigen/teichoic acid export membrane protein